MREARSKAHKSQDTTKITKETNVWIADEI